MPFAPSALPVGSIPAGTAGFWGARSQIHHLVLVPGDSACRLRLGPWFWIHRGCRVRTGLQVRGGGEARDPPFFIFIPLHCAGCSPGGLGGVSEPSPSPSIAGTARSCLHTTHLVFLLPRCLGLCPGGGKPGAAGPSLLDLLPPAHRSRLQLQPGAELCTAGMEMTQEPQSARPPNHCEPPPRGARTPSPCPAPTALTAQIFWGGWGAVSQPASSWSTRAWGCSPAPRSFWGPSPGPTEPPPAPRVSSPCPPSPSHVGMGPRYDPTEHLPCPCCFAPSCRHRAPPRAPFSLCGEQGRGPPAPTPPVLLQL